MRHYKNQTTANGAERKLNTSQGWGEDGTPIQNTHTHATHYVGRNDVVDLYYMLAY